MSLMYWTPEIAVGSDLIDNQHRSLIERVNCLVAAIEEGREEEEIARLFDFLKEYTQDHFTAEERLMRDSGYPESEGHAAEHRAFCEKIADLEGRMAAEGMTRVLKRDFDEAVIDWLFDHICRTDRALGKYLGA